MTAVREDHARVAYDAFASVYDRFTAGHDQEAWTGTILGLAERAGLNGRRLLDVGCGTGSAIAPMLARGFSVVGVDISQPMLDRACTKLGDGVTLECADMRALSPLGEFDLVWSLCDAVNYLQSPDELVAAFSSMRANLAPGGVVAFDVDSLGTLRALSSSLMVMPGEQDVVVFEGMATEPLPSGGIMTARFDHLVASQAPWWRRERSVHHQRHHPEAEVRSALADAGLPWADVWGTDPQGQVEQPFDDLRHTKAVYIARASAPDVEGR